MVDRDTIMRERQLVVQREMQRRGIALKAVHLDSGIPYPTIRSYFPGERNATPHVIPMSAVFAIIEGVALPLDLVSLLLPDGFQIVQASEEIDHDWLCEKAQEFVDEKMKAHRADSPAGPNVCPIEELPGITRKAMEMRA